MGVPSTQTASLTSTVPPTTVKVPPVSTSTRTLLMGEVKATGWKPVKSNALKKVASVSVMCSSSLREGPVG